MGLVIRPINLAEDNLEQVSHLLIRNGLNATKYAITPAAWRFQYIENPNRKSWVSILIDEELRSILGHIGLLPLPLIQNSQQFLAGGISNGVIDCTVRNKLMQHNNVKSFPIVPLIDKCCKNAFENEVKLIFAFSSIHSLIWKNLHFKLLDIQVDESWHLNFLDAYKTLVSKLKFVIENRWLSYLIKSYAFFLALCSQVVKHVSLAKAVKSLINNKVQVVQFEYFDNSFEPLFKEFVCDHPNVIMYERSIAYLNWRYESASCLKYKFTYMGELIGYCVLRKDSLPGSNVHQMEDFMILKSRIDNVSPILAYLLTKENLSFKMQHFLSCNYSFMLFNEFRNHSDTVEVNPLRSLFCGEKKKISNPFYYKLNDDIMSQETQNSFSDSKNWLIEPLFFTPVFHK